MNDGSVRLRLLPALDSSVTDYYVVVVPDELAQNKRPADFSLDEVSHSAPDSLIHSVLKDASCVPPQGW